MGLEERLPLFAVIKVPLMSADRVQKYLVTQFENFTDISGNPATRPYRRRRWIVRWADLPQAAQGKLQNSGELIIKATAAYTGQFDYTWTQVKQYFRDQETGLDETADL